MRSFLSPSVNACLRYHDLPGEGLPLLFVHGLGCASSCDYVRVASEPSLVGRRRLLVDLLGAGFSDRPLDFAYTVEAHAQTLVELVDALRLEAFDLFGHSAGGPIAIEAAGRLGDRLTHLVLSEPNLDAGGGTYSRVVAGQSEVEYVSEAHDEVVRLARREPSPIWAGSLALWLAEAVHRLSVSLVRGGRPSWRAQLEGLRCPRTVIFGEQSLPDPDTTRLPEAGIAVRIVSHAGHSMAWENPRGLAEAIRESLN